MRDPLATPIRHPGKTRSAIKTLSWRLAATLDTFLLSYFITGSFVWAGSIASAEVLTKMVLYYLHERAWAHVDWGFK